MPIPREHPVIMYEQTEQQLIIFGGFCNYPINDQFGLNISKITGPEYAIYNISPILGPLTGKTRCVIKGEGFKPNLNFQVRFALGE